ncbi:MAG: ABC-F family ATP-binding cassette domain-containing protein [Thermoanaerobaculia bacterium]
MPPVLLSCESISKSFGAEPLFENLTFALSEGNHVGLVGRNGSGKSTLLRILAGLESPDSGIRALRRNLRVGYVPQDPIFAPGKTVEGVLTETVAADPTLDLSQRIARVGLALAKGGFDDASLRTDILSGGWRKRLAIAQQLSLEPDVLLLDEPTNHLDVDAILWLESLLRSEPEAFIVVSHDRYFLDNLARRMLELDPSYPGGLLQVNGTYSDFLEKRDELLQNQASYRESLANLVRREVEWLRRGAKARTTKSKARIQRAEELIGELDESRRRSTVGTTGIEFNASERKTKRLWSGRGLRKEFGDRTIVENFDLLLRPGARLGVLGPNGSGKTTLLRMIVGEIDPDEGEIERADQLRTVYFEQNRESLDPDLTLRRALAPEGDSVLYQDRSLHVVSWARRFLFRTEQLEMPVSRLSGGEKARIILARLMLQPADLLVLDEPTNDLDIPTLDVLEESLLEFSGALVIVTHDRFLLDRVSTRILALDGTGRTEFFADYSQWEESRRSSGRSSGEPKPATAERSDRPRAKKLTYHEQREWDAMEETLLGAETRLERARAAVNDPAVATDAEELSRRFAALRDAEAEVSRLYERWAELEEKGS